MRRSRCSVPKLSDLPHADTQWSEDGVIVDANGDRHQLVTATITGNNSASCNGVHPASEAVAQSSAGAADLQQPSFAEAPPVALNGDATLAFGQ